MISTAAMTHPVESYAIKFSSGGKSAVYSGDSTYNTVLPAFASGCNLLVADSGFLDEQLTDSAPHMSAAQCAKIALDAGVGRLVLSHLNPYTDPKLYLNEALGIFKKTTAAVLMKEEEV